MFPELAMLEECPDAEAGAGEPVVGLEDDIVEATEVQPIVIGLFQPISPPGTCSSGQESTDLKVWVARLQVEGRNSRL